MRADFSRFAALAAVALACAACGSTTGASVTEDATNSGDLAVGDVAGTDAAAVDVAGTDAVADAAGDLAVADVQPGTDAVLDAAPDVAKPDAAVNDVAPTDVATPQNCGGKTSIACGSGEYCKTVDGSCGAIGVCTAKPLACTDIYAPVCGCDGQNYGSACLAAAGGVNVEATGTCPTTGPCGGFAGKPCGSSQFCDPSGCGADMTGTCVDVTPACPKNFAPVCGCDGNTYANDCYRILASTGKAYIGACKNSGCNIGDNTGCGKSQFCQASASGLCSGVGTCATIPTICPMYVKPVCGCDGKDYGNSCEANAAGTNVASDGNCATSPGGCFTTKDCTGGLACKSGVCGTCMGIMCTALACPAGQVKDQCCQCYTP